MKVLIIEDESKAARELAKILLRLDDTIAVVSIIVSIEHALLWFKSNPQPDLIFSDVQLADGLCFDIYKEIQIECPIIFCTAFDEFMTDAFETNAISYLLKPINEDQVEKALYKFKTLKQSFQKNENQNKISNLIDQLKSPFKKSLLLNQKEKIIPVQVKDIAYIFLEKNAVNITSFNGQRFYMTMPLDEMERLLDPFLFFRANRQFLVNRNAIQSVERYFARKLIVRLSMNTPETIIVSKARTTEFLKWLEGNY